jgi:hypothetical protein
MKNKVLCEPAAREFSPTGMTEDFRWKRDLWQALEESRI